MRVRVLGVRLEDRSSIGCSLGALSRSPHRRQLAEWRRTKSYECYFMVHIMYICTIFHMLPAPTLSLASSHACIVRFCSHFSSFFFLLPLFFLFFVFSNFLCLIQLPYLQSHSSVPVFCQRSCTRSLRCYLFLLLFSVYFKRTVHLCNSSFVSPSSFQLSQSSQSQEAMSSLFLSLITSFSTFLILYLLVIIPLPITSSDPYIRSYDTHTA